MPEVSTGQRRIYTQAPWWKNAAASIPTIPVEATPDFIELLSGLNASLILSNRKDSAVLSLSVAAGRCEVAVAPMPAPMGLARRGDCLAVGTSMALRVFRDLSPADADAAHYAPVATHITGAVSVHDVEWSGTGELWFVNTQFSSLCTIAPDVSFRMRWRPDFVRSDGPVDACHLNGMALAGGRPAFATALAASDGREGWRAPGPDAGVLLDAHGRVLREGLSLPHSPRLHDGALWLLESGAGRVLRLDPATGRGDVVMALPGMLRGMDFIGHHAFVAMSRVRAGSGDATRILSERFPGVGTCRVFAFDARTGAPEGSAELAMASEVATLHAHPKPRVRLLEPTPQQMATTLVVES